MPRNISGNPFLSNNQQSRQNTNTNWNQDSTCSSSTTRFRGNNHNSNNVFNHLPPSLKQHKDFFSYHNGNLLCNICELTVNTSKVDEHIKTKSHEDNIILFLKYRLPTPLQNMLEFTSFHMSNLSCNLCRCKIEFTSANVYETILNIVSHNFQETHAARKSNCIQNSAGDIAAANLTLRNLSEKFPIIKDNKHLIESTVDFIFKCKKCDKNIAFGKKDNLLVDNFISHFSTPEHKGLKITTNEHNNMKHQKENFSWETNRQISHLLPCSSESNLNVIHNETVSFEPKKWMSSETILKPNKFQEDVSATQKKSRRKGFFSPLIKMFRKH